MAAARLESYAAFHDTGEALYWVCWFSAQLETLEQVWTSMHDSPPTMMRFGTKSLLIGFAVIAVWLSTVFVPNTYGAAIGAELRKVCILVALLAMGCAACCYRGRRRAFFAGACITGLILSVNSSPDPQGYFPNLRHLAALCGNYLASNFGMPMNLQVAFEENLRIVLMLALCLLVGIYRRTTL
jgi:hypothetical protein